MNRFAIGTNYGKDVGFNRFINDKNPSTIKNNIGDMISPTESSFLEPPKYKEFLKTEI